MFNKNKCKHLKLTVVQEDGYQYCTKCNKAFAPPKKVCNHVWRKEDVLTSEFYHDRINKYIYIYCCTKCGIRVKNTSRDEKFRFPD